MREIIHEVERHHHWGRDADPDAAASKGLTADFTDLNG